MLTVDMKIDLRVMKFRIISEEWTFTNTNFDDF